MASMFCVERTYEFRFRVSEALVHDSKIETRHTMHPNFNHLLLAFFFSSLHLDATGHAVPLAGSGSVSGLTCVVINVLLYGSPLVMMKTVIQTRSVKCFGNSEKQGK